MSDPTPSAPVSSASASAAAPACSLRALADDRRIELGGELVAGRDEQCDLVLIGGQTSRRHAKLSPRADGIWVEDLQSTNGTFIDDRRISGGELAVNGTIVRFDTVAFEVSAPVVAAEGATVMRAMPAAAASAEATIMKPRAAEPESAPAPAAAKPVARDQVVAGRSGATPPPSWALDAQQSVDGTQFLSGAQQQQMNAQRAEAAAPLVAVVVPTLLGLSDSVRDVKFQLDASGSVNQWEIGRADSADVRIDDPSVSKSHAQIINEGSRWKLIDLMSANGTYVNGSKGLTTYLRSGDAVRFGQIEFQFLLGDGASTNPRAAAVTPVAAAEQQPSRVKLALVSFAITALVIAVAGWLLLGR